MEKRKDILFMILFLLIALPFFQQQTQIFPSRPLTGSTDPHSYPQFSFDSWFKGTFQAGFEQSTEDRIGFRPTLIRIKNQLQYTLFRKANAKGVVVGKKRFLYEYDYLRSYAGVDFLGEWFWQEKFRRLNRVRDTLHEIGTEIALVLEPGKASYYPEYIPKSYLKNRKDSTNYREIIRQADRIQIPMLDINQFFMNQKDLVEIPYYTREGIHWAYNGMLAGVDTLLSFADRLVPERVPDMHTYEGVITHEARDTDDDLAQLMNLIVTPSHDLKEYPSFRIESVQPGERAHVLAISDSYYFNILNAHIPEKAFANQAFWYYSKAIYPDTWSAPKDTSMINFQEEVEKMDLILLMATERFYYKLAWNFIETLYRKYYPDEIRNLTYDYCVRIITDYQWFDLVVKDATQRGVSLNEALIDHANYQFWKDDQAGRVPKDISYYVRRILKDPAWSAKIREKAKSNQISFDRQLFLDAKWMVDND